MFPDADDHVRAHYSAGGRPGLHLAFNFNRSPADVPWNANAFRNIVAGIERTLPADSWPCWVLSNHDRVRHASRFDPAGTSPARAKAAATVLLTLRGTPVLYFGEEIRMRNVNVPPDRRLDPVGFAFPGFGRDGERTPMRWQAGKGLGFTLPDVEPWLPDGGYIPGCDVAAQSGDPASVLAHYRTLLRLRRERLSLRRGRYVPIPSVETMLAFVRDCDGERTGVAVNFGTAPESLPAELRHGTALVGEAGDELAPDGSVVVALD